LVVRGGKFYRRRRIPQDVHAALGRVEIWRSLETDSQRMALQRFPFVASQIEVMIAQARFDAGISVDSMMLEPVGNRQKPRTFVPLAVTETGIQNAPRLEDVAGTTHLSHSAVTCGSAAKRTPR